MGTPANQKDVRAFLGLTGYYRKYVPDYGDVAEPLVRLTDAKAPFVWTTECQRAFKELKDRLVSAPILAFPTTTDTFVLDTDASNLAIGAVLSQQQDGVERVIAYGSRALTKEERNYCVTRRELLAVVHFVEAYKYYLYGKPFLLRTDHSSLRWMLHQKDPKDQLARWIQKLSPYQFTIEHRAGKKHGNADAMSRKCFRGGNCYHPEPAAQVPEGATSTSEEWRREEPVTDEREASRSPIDRASRKPDQTGVTKLLHEGSTEASCPQLDRPERQRGSKPQAANRPGTSRDQCPPRAQATVQSRGTTGTPPPVPPCPKQTVALIQEDTVDDEDTASEDPDGSPGLTIGRSWEEMSALQRAIQTCSIF